MRLSGPRDRPHRPPGPARRRRRPICQPDARPGIKPPTSPAAFPTTLNLPFLLYQLCRAAQVVPQASMGSTCPCRRPFPLREYTTRPVRKMPQHYCPLWFARPSPQQSLLDRPTVDRPLKVTPIQWLAPLGRRRCGHAMA